MSKIDIRFEDIRSEIDDSLLNMYSSLTLDMQRLHCRILEIHAIIRNLQDADDLSRKKYMKHLIVQTKELKNTFDKIDRLEVFVRDISAQVDRVQALVQGKSTQTFELSFPSLPE